MSNRVNLTLDITKTGIQNPLIKVRQGDGGFETLRTTVTSNGEPMDLQGWTITFMGTTAGNHKIVDGNVKIVESPIGIFDYTPSKAWGMDIGDFKIAYFKFVKGDGSASSANFRVRVIEAIDLTQEEAQNYISVVDATIAEAREHLESSLADVSSSVAATSSAASSLAINVSSVASNASLVASSATSNVSSVASSAVSEVTSAASNVSSVAASVVDKLNNISVGGRNYILNSKRALVGSGNLYDIGWVYSSMPISAFSNKKITVSVQVDYDNVTSLDGASRIGFAVSANQKNADGTSVNKDIDVWRFPSVGDSFHGRIYSTFDLSNINLESKYASNQNLWQNGMLIQGVTGTNVSISNPKIEIGNIATDWTPAPEDVDNTFLKKSNELPAEARDFNYLANHMQTYQGTWYNRSESVANAPVGNWTYSVIEVIAGNAETTGVIRTARFGSSATYSANVNGGAIQYWTLIADDANVVHKTGNEVIAGDKTLAGKVIADNFVSNNVPVNLTKTTTSEMWYSSTLTAYRTGNTVTIVNYMQATNTIPDNNTSREKIPAGYRPSTVLYYPAVYGSSLKGELQINPDGTFTARGAINGQYRVTATYITGDAWPV